MRRTFNRDRYERVLCYTPDGKPRVGIVKMPVERSPMIRRLEDEQPSGSAYVLVACVGFAALIAAVAYVIG